MKGSVYACNRFKKIIILKRRKMCNQLFKTVEGQLSNVHWNAVRLKRTFETEDREEVLKKERVGWGRVGA
jgi:hypothetical protein